MYKNVTEIHLIKPPSSAPIYWLHSGIEIDIPCTYHLFPCTKTGEQAEQDVERALASFEKSGKVPSTIMEAR